MIFNERYQRFLATLFAAVLISSCGSQDQSVPKNDWDTAFSFDWVFAKGDQSAAIEPEFDDSDWQQVNLPHDWAISGPFGDPAEDGNTGKLPWKGEGWYRKTFTLPEEAKGKRLQFLFDGVMANPQVYLNGEKAGSWRYGYNSFWIDATDAAKFGAENVLTVQADTREHHSRWYPGAGIYRKVRMRLTDNIYIPVWGIFVSTPEVSDTAAVLTVEVEIVNGNSEKKNIRTEVVIRDPSGTAVSTKDKITDAAPGNTLEIFRMETKNPQIWDIKHPNVYTCTVSLFDGEVEIHRQKTTFGIRTFQWTADDGFHLNGRRVQLQGVNLHHDQGPLGAAFFPRAMERQLEIMKDMGVNAIRTSHNACAPELLDLCDRMGFIVFNELFDKYGPTAGVECSVEEFVDNYAEAEVRNFVLRDRNHPSVFLWSVGNEISEILTDADGKSAEHMADMVGYFRQYDTTRPTTMGCHISSVSDGVKKILDPLETAGWNYARRYASTRKYYPDMPLIYSESASAFGTRGAYKPNLPKSKTDYGTDGDVSAYMLTAAPWSDIPEIEFEYMRIDPYMAGEFVWTGFDYLGEPTPFVHGKFGVQTPEGHVARSSYFGIVDLAGLPKDSYYNYRSLWKNDEHTIHLTPHWNWADRNVASVPVMLYTDGDEAELFVNGKSMGRKKKIDPRSAETSRLVAENPDYVVGRFDYEKDIIETPDSYYDIVNAYRLIWPEVPYEPGEIKAVVYKDGSKIGETAVETAGKPERLELSADREKLSADGMDLCYVTVSMTDDEGIVCPWAADELSFEVKGAAQLAGVANGDAMGHDVFTDDKHSLFYGKAVAVLRNIPGMSGEAVLKVANENGVQAEIKVMFE